MAPEQNQESIPRPRRQQPASRCRILTGRLVVPPAVVTQQASFCNTQIVPTRTWGVRIRSSTGRRIRNSSSNTTNGSSERTGGDDTSDSDSGPEYTYKRALHGYYPPYSRRVWLVRRVERQPPSSIRWNLSEGGRLQTRVHVIPDRERGFASDQEPVRMGGLSINVHARPTHQRLGNVPDHRPEGQN